MGPRRIGSMLIVGSVVGALVACSAPRPSAPAASSGAGSPRAGASTASGAAASSSSSRAPAPPAPGATAVRDPLLPGRGNGGYDVDHYDLSLRYASADVRDPITGTATLRATASEPLSRFDLDFDGSVGAVTVDGASATVAR